MGKVNKVRNNIENKIAAKFVQFKAECNTILNSLEQELKHLAKECDHLAKESDQLVTAIKTNWNKELSKFNNNIQNLKAEHLKFFRDTKIILNIIAEFENKQKVEIIKGGHVKINDGGMLLDILVEAGILTKKKIDSHYNDDQKWDKKVVYSFNINDLFKEISIGKATDKNGKTITYLQIEAHSVNFSLHPSAIINLLKHILVDYLYYYLLKGLNKSQYGECVYTELNPITEEGLNKSQSGKWINIEANPMTEELKKKNYESFINKIKAHCEEELRNSEISKALSSKQIPISDSKRWTERYEKCELTSYVAAITGVMPDKRYRGH